MEKISVIAMFGLLMILTFPLVSAQSIPDWVKNNAGWWAEDAITDADFISGIQFLVKEKILNVPPTNISEESSQGIPDWVKNNAGWWAEELISDEDFINGIQFLIKIGIISIQEQVQTQTLIGEFVDADFIHKTSGKAIIIINEKNQKTLQFKNFETLNGPDLFVYLSKDNSIDDFVNLGMLETFRGEQSYPIDNSVDLSEYNRVLIWCKAFGVLFGSAELF